MVNILTNAATTPLATHPIPGEARPSNEGEGGDRQGGADQEQEEPGGTIVQTSRERQSG